MVNNERPGVYTSYEVTSAVTGGSGIIVGAVGSAVSGETNKVYIISSLNEATVTFGAGSALEKLTARLLMNGAGAVHAVAVASDDADGYGAAFVALCADEQVGIMVCDSRDAEVHAAMKEAIEGASEKSKYRIGVVESSGSVSELTEHAALLNSERMVLCAPCDETAGSLSAAVAGALAKESDPALPLNGAVLQGVGSAEKLFTDGEINTLVRGGVTVVETVGGETSVVRGVTTRTETGGEADDTWREITTVRIIDTVLPTVRRALRSRFSRSKNTARTRGAIRTQVVVELEDFLAREIISGYGDVTAEQDSADPTVCAVNFSFTVAHGLNQICLQAHITV